MSRARSQKIEQQFAERAQRPSDEETLARVQWEASHQATLHQYYQNVIATDGFRRHEDLTNMLEHARLAIVCAEAAALIVELKNQIDDLEEELKSEMGR